MKLTDPKIKEFIGSGRIKAITVDTCIFDGCGNRFERGLLAKLSQFNDTPIDFVLSDIVAGEVLSHVAGEANDSMLAVRKAFKEVGRCWQVTDEQRAKALSILFGDESPEILAKRRFEAFKEAAQVEMVDSGGRVDVAKLIKDYFSTKPPFGSNANKKNEFPDAIALQALESWASERNLLVIAVSKDNDWITFCENSSNLIAVGELSHALSLFHQNAEVACSRLVQRLNEGKLKIEEDLNYAAQAAVERINFFPEVTSGYFFEAELIGVQVTSIQLQPDTYDGGAFRVVDKPEENVLVVEAEIDVVIDIAAEFAFYVYDSIDKEDVPIGSADPTVEQVLTFKVLLTFEGDLSKDAELVDVEVQVPRINMHASFGGIGPDFDPCD